MRLSSLKAAQNNQLAVKASGNAFNFSSFICCLCPLDEGEGAKSSRLGVGKLFTRYITIIYIVWDLEKSMSCI